MLYQIRPELRALHWQLKIKSGYMGDGGGCLRSAPVIMGGGAMFYVKWGMPEPPGAPG